MTPEQIKTARHQLGLTLAQLAPLLDTDSRALRSYEAPTDRSSARKAPPRLVRLLMAYLDGYRPDDWPAGK